MRVIVFDLDGTLVDSRADLVQAVNAALEAEGFPQRPPEGVARHIGRGAAHLVRMNLPESRRDEATVRRVLEAFRASYFEHLADTTRPYDGVPEALAALAEEARLGVLTNKPGEAARRLLEALGLDGAFRLVLGGGDVPRLKPHPAGLAEALRRLGGAPAQSYYVGDLPLDVETARGAGCKAAVVTWGFGEAAELRAARPDRVVTSPMRLPALAR
ncbi:MAG: HAD family hydrolase [Deltaproteobacteria bacterium]|nr:MAG: HAD family hydrolase [Deltaproteobacteria bacterium]